MVLLVEWEKFGVVINQIREPAEVNGEDDFNEDVGELRIELILGLLLDVSLQDLHELIAECFPIADFIRVDRDARVVLLIDLNQNWGSLRLA